MAAQTNTAETGTHNNAATASIVEATKGAFVNRELLSAVILNDRLDKSSRIVLAALCSYANVQQHHAWPSVAGVARRAGCTERNARSHLRQLERDGYITAVRDSAYSTTAYRIEAERLWREQEDRAAGAPRFASTEISGGAEKAARGAEKSVTEHTIFSAKEGKKKDIEKEKEEGGYAHAHATPLASLTTEPTFPALPSFVFENLVPVNSPATARSTASATCEAATPATTALPTSKAQATAPALPEAATPAPSVDTLIDLPQLPSSTTTEAEASTAADDVANAATATEATGDTHTTSSAAETATPSDDLLNRINAQRVANGKQRLTQRDITQLATEATKAGITPTQAAQWVLARPGRNFFRADYYKPADAAPQAAAEAPAQPVLSAAAIAAQKAIAALQPAPPQTDEEKAAAAEAAARARARNLEIIAEQRAKEAAAQPAAQTAVPTPPASPVPATTTGPSPHELALSRQLAQRCADNTRLGGGQIATLFTGTSAAPITTAPTAPAAGLLPEVGPKKWAAAIVNRALRGQHVSRGPLEEACKVVGMSFASVQASRITATA